MWSARRLMMFYISMKFNENILNGFQVIERTRLHDGWTDRQTYGWSDRRTDYRGKNSMSPPLSGGHIIVKILSLIPQEAYVLDIFSSLGASERLCELIVTFAWVSSLTFFIEGHCMRTEGNLATCILLMRMHLIYDFFFSRRNKKKKYLFIYPFMQR